MAWWDEVVHPSPHLSYAGLYSHCGEPPLGVVLAAVCQAALELTGLMIVHSVDAIDGWIARVLEVSAMVEPVVWVRRLVAGDVAALTDHWDHQQDHGEDVPVSLAIQLSRRGVDLEGTIGWSLPYTLDLGSVIGIGV